MEILLKIKIFFLKSTLWLLRWQLFCVLKVETAHMKSGTLLLVSDKPQGRIHLEDKEHKSIC